MIVPRAIGTAIPAITKLPECADWSKSVAPYIPQLYTLPSQLFTRINDLDALKELYLTTNPLITAFAFAIYFLAPLVLVAAEINKNYSQIDRLWGVLPVLYNGHYALWAHLHGLPTQKLDHVMAVSVLWGARLTYNFWRKGGFMIGSEDYRWVVVRKYAGNWMFLLDVTFISFGQSLLLFLITAPTYILLLTSRLLPTSLTTYDQLFSKLIFFFILFEFYADQQQWTYHQAKALYASTAKVPKSHSYTRSQLDRGFNTTGLFAWSRHPNFAAEQAVWVALYQWACCESYTFMNWTFAGAIGYLILFQASTAFTEMITSGKYPEYKIYQKRVGRFLPKGNTKSMDEPKNTEEERKANDAKNADGVGKNAGSIGKGKGKKR